VIGRAFQHRRSGYTGFDMPICCSAVVSGDTAFRPLLDGAVRSREHAEVLMNWALPALIGFATLMVLAAIAATPKEKRWTTRELANPLRASTGDSPRLTQIHWLERNEKTERRLRRSVIAVYISVALMLAVPTYLYSKLNQPRAHSTPASEAKVAEVRQLMLVMYLMAGSMPFLLTSGLRSMRHQLGTDGHQLLVRLRNGQVLTLAPEQVVYDRRRIAFESHTFSISTGDRRPLYQKGEIETYIAPLLNRATNMGPIPMLRYRLEHREPTLMITLASAAGFAAVLIATGTWKPLWAILLHKLGWP
jgi:hypothetical protein